MKRNNITEWNASYTRGENNILYPQSEVIKFLNRYISKKKSFVDIDRKLKINNDEKIVCLDFACGVGIHAITAEEFGCKSYGVDISEIAIKKAQQNAQFKGLSDLKDRLTILDTDYKKLPFSDKFFNFSIAESCLDSMHFEIAKNNFSELKRITKNYIYFSLIGSRVTGKAGEKRIDTEHEKGTIQCYFDRDLLNELIGGEMNRLIYFNRIVEKDLHINKIIDERYFCIYSCD